ncbi:hypothetical protein J4E93_005455 [Alternaria ventricosa]|uniref:uncharacterized protein n=1 Tax=Alternaria ventricosa TaxID=1187951 RepID=UPI0020C4A2C0|nr:uncharacterized protein J4E93_005455 [Alternaria ventricosa]KAI4645877.1 hypothetical protein J4E93_005455 [Alternaria ventricosa]
MCSHFLITPTSAYKDIIESIKHRFRGELKEVWPCDVNGEPIGPSEPGELFDGVEIPADSVSNFGNIQDGERIIVRVSKNERVFLETKHETILYSGDELGHNQFKGMGGIDRRDHIRAFRRQEAAQRKNIIRLTSSPRTIAYELSIRRYSPVYALKMILEEWKIVPVNPVDQNCLGALAILSKATCGQQWAVECLLMDEMTKRKAAYDILQESDVVQVIKNLYKEAFASGSVWEGHPNLWERTENLLDY